VPVLTPQRAKESTVVRAVNVEPITRRDYLPFLIDVHYAGRVPSVSRAFGLFVGSDLEGVVTYGTPPSAPLRRGVCGDAFKECVIELNRLVLLSNHKNDASLLVGRSLRLLGGDFVVVSFADTAQGHVGYVYQATNFMYCGLSAKRTDWRVRGMEHLHGQTIADEFRGRANRAQAMRDKYGSDFYLSPRSRKHRYVTFIGSRNFKRNAMKSLRYRIEPYPKRTG